jgi:hypothetical protein
MYASSPKENGLQQDGVPWNISQEAKWELGGDLFPNQMVLYAKIGIMALIIILSLIQLFLIKNFY